MSGVEAISPRVAEGRPIVASVNETMATLKIGREKIYQLLNSGELESYREGGSRKILWRSIEAYVERRLKQEAERRGRAA
jgi:excisionase family DNA binding protein